MEDKVPIMQNAISVSELNATIHACLDSPIYKGLDIFGEVSGFKLSGAHAYFTLKDQFSQLSCVRFSAARGYIPKDGESVILHGSVDYYMKGGRLSFQVSSITPVGQGLLFLQLERLKAKLTAEGLFDEAHKKPIPKYAKNVVVLTSKTGAVIRDIVTTVRRKNPVVNITVKDVRVQGEGAAREIAGALRRVDLLNYDVIIIARGGGSLEDLAPFYDEELVRAIYDCNTPVVSAVGHETDFSLSDFVADMRAPTPTAAAELVAYDYYGQRDRVYELSARLRFLALKQFDLKTNRLRVSTARLSTRAQGFYNDRSNRVLNLISRLERLTSVKLDKTEHKLDGLMNALDNLSPLKTLRRGYFSLSADKGQIKSVAQLAVGDKIKAIGGDGFVEAEVTAVFPKETL